MNREEKKVREKDTGNNVGQMITFKNLSLHCSTTMSTWMVIESISYFTWNGSDIFTCAMDMTKAFDMVQPESTLVQHSLMFKKLINLRFSLIFTRLLIKMYTPQYANVLLEWKELSPISHK